MLLPDADAAVVDAVKMVDYLLNASHPDNGGKAAFFAGWGFTPDEPWLLERAIRGMIAVVEVAQTTASPYGVKHVVDGPLASPRGVTPLVRTVWIVDGASGTTPRLVTAYPARPSDALRGTT